MKSARLALFCLFLAGSLCAAPPELVIPAEVAASPGQWVVVIPTTTAKSVVYVGLDGLSAFPSSELKDPRKLVLYAPAQPARFRFVAVGTLNDEQVVQAFVVVVGAAPPVPPGPGPGPDPPKPQPDGPLGLTKASRDGMAKVNLPAADWVAQSAKLATAQRAHASAVAAGAFSTPAAILKGWQNVNNAAVPAGPWAPWGTDVSAALRVAYEAGRLPDNNAWSAAFREIGTGIDGVQ